MPSLLDGFLGQQDMPTFAAPSVGQWSNAIGRVAPKLGAAGVAYNEAMGPGIANLWNTTEKIYDPNRYDVRNKAGKLLSLELDDPYAVPSGLARLLRQQGFESNGPGGGNISEADINNVFSVFGREAENRAQGIISEGLGYGSNTFNPFQAQPLGATPGDAGSVYAGGLAAKNANSMYESSLNAANARNLIMAPIGALAAPIGALEGGGGGSSPMTGASGAPNLQAGSFGGAGQPSFETGGFAMPVG